MEYMDPSGSMGLNIQNKVSGVHKRILPIGIAIGCYDEVFRHQQ